MTDKNAESPTPNLLVIRSKDIHRAVEFYHGMGISFDLHSHGKGPEHYAAEIAGFVFEIYPFKYNNHDTLNTRIGFKVNNIDKVVSLLRNIKSTVVSDPIDTEWGRRAVLKDFDGHTVELIEAVDNE